MEPQDTIQENIYQYGRIKAARLITGNEFAAEYADGYSQVLSDPRIGSEGPIKSVELGEGLDQMLATNFENLWSTAIFKGSDGKDHDEEAIRPTIPALEHA
jgi:hypothetical protein